MKNLRQQTRKMSRPPRASRNVLQRIIQKQSQRQQTMDFNRWCDRLYSLPIDYKLELKDDLIVAVELQPIRWMNLGLIVLESAKVVARVSLSNNRPGPVISSYLPYPTFQMGAEIFLKGMWLCQYEDCRLLSDASYINPDARRRYLRMLGRGAYGLGHDLLKIIEAIRNIRKYRTNRVAMRFLKIVESVIRQFYFPLYQADQRGSHWSRNRYPKRFYNDSTKESRADAWSRYPEQALVARLFRNMKAHVDRLWQLHANLVDAAR
ncbi:MAG: hypothetical protein ACREIF_02165 [Chthoniobacterales bacterium]